MTYFQKLLLSFAYLVRRQGNVFTGICLSVCPHGGGGYPVSGQRSCARTGIPPPLPRTGHAMDGTPLAVFVTKNKNNLE